MSVIAKRLIACALLIMLVVSSFPGVVFAEDYLYSGAFTSIHGGIVDKRNNATIVNSTSGAVIVPNPSSEEYGSKPVVVDSYNWKSKEIPLSSIRQIQVEYKFSGSTEGLGHPKISILPMTSGTYLPEAVSFYSYERIEKTTSWKTLTFEVYTDETAKTNVSNELRRKLLSTDEILRQVHFYFYGQTPASQLAKTQKLTIGNITLSTTELETDKSYVKYDKGFPAAYLNSGVYEDEVEYVSIGDTITLPECPYSMEGFEFDGWVSWYAYEKYYPGDEMTVVGDTMLVADWRAAGSDQDIPDYIVVDLQDYITGFISPGTKRGTYSENNEFDGVQKLAKFVPNTTLSNQDDDGNDLKSANLDSYPWGPAGVDMRQYKYLSVVYYWKTDTPVYALFKWSVLKTGTDLTSSVSKTATMKANQWAVANFNISSLASSLDENASLVSMYQCHIRPFSNRFMSELDENDELYLGKAIFYKNKPQKNPLFVTPAIQPISSGTLGLTKAMTRAEALVSITRLIGRENNATTTSTVKFTDIDSTDPLNAYAVRAVLDGWLSGDGTTAFNPDDKLTYDEFLEWMTGVARFSNGDSSGVGVGSDAVAPTNNFILSAITGDKPVTRGEFVAMASVATAGANSTNVLASALPTISDVPNYLSMYKIAATLCSDGVAADGQLVLALRNVLGLGDSISSEVYESGAAYISQLDTLSAERIAEIRSTGNTYYDKYVSDNSTFGNVYFVSNNGSDSNDGKTPETAFATLSKLASTSLSYGDAVFFERGSVFRQTSTLNAVSGVTYSSYGEGAKPEIWGSDRDLANTGSWSIYARDTSTGMKIWKYSDNMVDTGALFLINDGNVVSVAAKEIPNYDSTYATEDTVEAHEDAWRVRGETTVKFDIIEQLDNDLEYVCFANKTENSSGELELNLLSTSNGYASDNENYKEYKVPNSTAIGELYLRCDAGNPASVYDSIELAPKRNGISVGSRVGITIDNITIKYVGNHGIGAGTTKNLKVTDCEIGWIGGAIQHYNTGKTSVGTVTRFGNGVEVYGGCSNYVIDNCYVYEVYDAGITHQVGGQTNSIFMDDIDYTNNVIEYCTYNIEYFASPQADSALADSYCFMKDLLFENNILRMAGYGWGQQRPDSSPASIKGWPRDTNNASNYVIRNNIIDRCTNRLMEVGSVSFGGAPYFDTNTFVQHAGNGFAYFHNDLNAGGMIYFYYSDMTETTRRMAQNNPTYYYAKPLEWDQVSVYHRSNAPGTY